jgi:hypothetical protein
VTAADLLQVEAAVGLACGDSPADAKMAWVTSPAARKKLRQTSRFAAGATPVWESHTDRHPLTGELETIESVFGSVAVSTTNVSQTVVRGSSSATTMIAYGNWTELIINLFTEFDVLVNPYMQSQTGVVRISTFVDCDSVIRRAGAFGSLVGILTT